MVLHAVDDGDDNVMLYVYRFCSRDPVPKFNMLVES